MYSLPTKIKIGDNEFNIRNNGDYRMVLECFSALQDTELSEEERIISSLIIFYEDFNSYRDVAIILNDDDLATEAVKKMYDFFNCGQKDVGAKQNYKLIDWEQDSQTICSAINNVAKTEIRSVEYCHWWTFMGYYLSIGESVLSTVVGIRDKIARGKKLEDYENKFKKDNPQYFAFDYRSASQIQEDEEFRRMWEGGQ